MNISVHTLRVSNDSIINYCYLIRETQTNSAVLVDPAWQLNIIEDAIASDQANLTAILLTHHHPDHVHLASPLATKYQVPVYMSKTEIDFYQFSCANLTAIETFEKLTLSGLEINPIFTPGHTKGGTSYLMGNNLFCGDTLFIEGCGICTGKGADPAIMFDTLQMLKNRIAPDTYIYPGHSYGQPVGKNFEFVLLNNMYLQMNKKEEFIAFRMRPNQTNLFKFK